jgi:hypothetical protein
MMDILASIVDEHIQEKEGWQITDALAADWALDKIREAKADYAQKEMVVKEKIRQLQEWLEREREKRDRTVNFFTTKLEEYFETTPRRKTKTQEIFELPSGVLRRKFPQPKYDIDEDKLVKWLKERKLDNYIKTVEKPKWAEFKKVTKTVNDKVVDENGEIVEGIRVVERPPTFEVEV